MSEQRPPEVMICPHCGATLEYDGRGEKTIKCAYCGNAVGVPEQYLARNSPPVAVKPSTASNPDTQIGPGYYIVAFLLIMACFGVFVYFILTSK
ncbi:MAG TPA: hypothetical protein VGK87_06305 [Anaerolineae bacterium]|jgi:LSD1 subclass zinc finger protein